MRQDFKKLSDTISGMQASFQTELAVIRKDIQYMNRTNMPTLIVSLVALILSICSGFVALDNRALILSVSAQTSKNTRDLENMMPIVFSTPGPEPTNTPPGKE